MFLGFEERFDEAISRGRRSLEIDPLSPVINMNVGWTYFSAGLLDEALDQAGKMIEIEPDFFGAYWLKGAIYLSEGEYEEAVEELKKAVSLGGHQIVLADLGSAYGLAGKKTKPWLFLTNCSKCGGGNMFPQFVWHGCTAESERMTRRLSGWKKHSRKRTARWFF